MTNMERQMKVSVAALPVINRFMDLEKEVFRYLENPNRPANPAEQSLMNLLVYLYDRVEALFDAHEATRMMDKTEANVLLTELSAMTKRFNSLKGTDTNEPS